MVKPSVVLGSESWLNTDVMNSEIFPDCYTCYRKDRNSLGGGVFILVDSTISSCEVNVDVGTCEAVWCQLMLDNGKALSVCSFYRPPQSSAGVLSQLAQSAEMIKSDCMVIGGDFNLPTVEWSHKPCSPAAARCSVQEMESLIDVFSLHQFVREPTRGNNILDLILTNTPEIVLSTTVIPGISDHRAVISEMKLGYVKTVGSKGRQVYNYGKANVDGINDAIRAYLTVFEIEAESKNATHLWSMLKGKLLELRQRYVPSWVMTSRRSKSKPWFSKKLRCLSRKKEKLYRAYKQRSTEFNLEKLKRATHEFKSVLRSEKDAFFSTIHRRLQDNPKEFWKHVKRNGKDNLSIPPLKISDGFVCDDLEKAESFNQYFCSVFSTTSTTDNNQLLRCGTGVMEDLLISTRGIECLLQNLNVSKAGGPDGLSNSMLKLCAQSLAPFLKIIYDKSLHDSCIPEDWKNAGVVPIHKSGPRDIVSNYRGVSLTCVVCKILEHVLYTSIVEYMNANSLFNVKQHGFRKGLSCVTQLTEFVYDLAGALDERFSVDCVFLDFRKAFDTVPHFLLIKKLISYNINPQVISWIQEYLRLRRQFVIVNGMKSSPAEVTSGVPQGSVLGPLLFLIFINDITDGVFSNMRLFADDCVLYRTICRTEDSGVLQQDLERINLWCEKWRMQLNLAKCAHMTFTRKKITQITSYSINNTVLTQVLEYKYLGVFFTPDLTWNRHVDHVAAQACRALGFLRRNAKNFPQVSKELLYKSIVRSVMEYACTVWDPWTVKNSSKLERVQNQAARFVSGNYTMDFSATQTKDALGWELLECRRRKLRLKFFHSIYHSSTGLRRELYMLEPHYKSKRVDHEFKVREFSCKTDVFKRSFFPQTVSDWNRLPCHVISVRNNDTFFTML